MKNMPFCQQTHNYLSKSYLSANLDELDKVYALLADRYSQESFYTCLINRTTGKDINFVPAPWSDPPYFLENLMEWQEHECLVDAGAYTGDTMQEFLQKMPPSVKSYQVYAFEPSRENYARMANDFRDNPSIRCFNLGLYSKRTTLYFDGSSEAGRLTNSATSCRIKTDTIDGILGEDQATFIKMDIEGSELDALRGSVNQIQKYKPRMAICLYHRQDDLYEIPLFIHSLRPDYHFYVRPHSAMPTELVLYCT